LKNYIDLFHDERFLAALKTTVIFTVVSVALETVFGLLIAVIVNQPFKFRGVVRAAMLIPWAIPTAISSQMWKWMFNDQGGIMTKFLEKLNIIEPGFPILGSPNTALWAIIAVDVWKTTPF
ncbi:MAG: carbohydrate ABC transporter permease, partial [Fervidobacterium pennivorans]